MQKPPPKRGFQILVPESENAGSIFASRPSATHREWRVNRTFDNGFASERKNPPEAGSLNLVPEPGIEPGTRGFSIPCSTD